MTNYSLENKRRINTAMTSDYKRRDYMLSVLHYETYDFFQQFLWCGNRTKVFYIFVFTNIYLSAGLGFVCNKKF